MEETKIASIEFDIGELSLEDSTISLPYNSDRSDCRQINEIDSAFSDYELKQHFNGTILQIYSKFHIICRLLEHLKDLTPPSIYVSRNESTESEMGRSKHEIIKGYWETFDESTRDSLNSIQATICNLSTQLKETPDFTTAIEVLRRSQELLQDIDETEETCREKLRRFGF